MTPPLLQQRGTAARPASPAGFRGDIEGLRAVAVLLVLADHARLPLTGGYVGVDVFFVISGFLITGLLVRELTLTGTLSMAGFYARRARRLLPGAALVLVVTAVLTLEVLPRTRWADTGLDVLSSALYVQNWRLAEQAVDYQAQTDAASPLQHFWSLAVEEQFYFLWPALLLLVTVFVRPRPREGRGGLLAGRSRHPGRRATVPLLVGLVVVAVPSFTWSVLRTASDPQASYFTTTTRLWELAVGGGVAILAPRLASMAPAVAAALGWVGLAVVVWCAVTYTAATPFPGSAALAPVLGAAAVIGAGRAAGRAGPVAVLGLTPMRWVGRLSYSLYLWHWPLLVVATAAVGTLAPWQGAVVVLAAFLPAHLAFRHVEEPFRHGRGRRMDDDAPRALFTGGVLTAASVAAGLVLVFATWPPPPPPVDPAITAALAAAPAAPGAPLTGARVLADNPRDDPAGAPVDTSPSIDPAPADAKTDLGAACTKGLDETAAEGCVSGDPRSTVDVALVGDSHAAQWVGPLSVIAKQRGWRLTSYTKAICPFSTQDVAVGSGGVIRPYPQCDQWRDAVRAKLAATPPAMLVVSNVDVQAVVDGALVGQDASRPLLATGLQRMWQTFLDLGSRVVVLADTPWPGFDLPGCVAQHPDQLTQCTFDRDEADHARGTALAAATAATPGVTAIDLGDAVCPTQRCAPVIGGVLGYRDLNHMSNTYATTLAPRLDRLLPALS